MKVAIISGASGDIGREICKNFVKKEYFVFGIYNSDIDSINALREELKKMGLSDFFFAIKADLRKKEDIENISKIVFQSFKHVDVIVNNAGIDLYKTITETSLDDWDNVFSINTRSVFYLNNQFIPSMIERKSGKIIVISSIWGKVGASMEVAYSASKSALHGYVLGLSKELAPSLINVNCICPGAIDTKMNARFNLNEIEEIKDNTPLKRLGDTKEIADLVEFLSSDSASFITGQIISCDGGLSL